MLHIQSNAIRPTGDAPDRAHHTNITGFEVLARPSDIRHGASVRYLTGHVAASPSRVSPVADDFVTPGLLVRTASPTMDGARSAALPAKARTSSRPGKRPSNRH